MYLAMGYIDIFNNAMNHTDEEKFLIGTAHKEIWLKHNGNYYYNSEEYTKNVVEAIIKNLSEKGYREIELAESYIHIYPYNKCRVEHTQEDLRFEVYPSEDWLQVQIKEIELIIGFDNIIHCKRRKRFATKNKIITEVVRKVITIPSSTVTVPIKHFDYYRDFKKYVMDAIYADLTEKMINEINKIQINQWEINIEDVKIDINKLVHNNITITKAKK